MWADVKPGSLWLEISRAPNPGAAPCTPYIKKSRTGVNLWGNMLPQNGACNHFFPGRLGEIGTKVHFCCITDSELAQRLAWATSITRPAASAPAWRGHQEQIETAFSTRVLNGSEDDRTVNNSYQESPRFLCLWYGKPSAVQQTQCGSLLTQ